MSDKATYQRVMFRVDTSGGPDSCHPWTGATTRGYGHFRLNGRSGVRPHRWLLGYLRGHALTAAEVACHHCDNKLCCNPRHLYVGRQADNVRDMILRNPAAIQSVRASKTHCDHGHEFTPENTYIWSRRPSQRSCRACGRERAARRASTRRAA